MEANCPDPDNCLLCSKVTRSPKYDWMDYDKFSKEPPEHDPKTYAEAMLAGMKPQKTTQTKKKFARKFLKRMEKHRDWALTEGEEGENPGYWQAYADGCTDCIFLLKNKFRAWL